MKKLKKFFTIGLATTLTLSYATMAFAYAGNDDSESFGDDSTMTCHIDVDDTYAHASVSTDITSDLSIDGVAYYYSIDGDGTYSAALYGGQNETTSYGTSTHRSSSYMIQAQATFSVSAEDGSSNNMFLECSE